MARSRIILISMVALVMALGAAFLARGLAAPKRHVMTVTSAAAPSKPTIRVLVAKRDLAVGDVLGPDSISWQPWPADAVNPSFIVQGAAQAPATTSNGKIVAAAQGAAAAATSVMTGDLGPAGPLMGSVVRVAMVAHEPIAPAKLVKGGAGGLMAVTLAPGMRAMSIPITAESGAGGFILPGDHVDVLVTRKADASGQGVATAHIVLKNVRVLAVDQSAHATQDKPAVVGATSTLEVTPQEAEVLVSARAQGDLTLMLRAYTDAQGPTEIGSAGGDSGVVHVFRSGQATDVKVAR
ncbi:MAG: Flp pilus assembly protein CpaB [Caulobacteraceae bacterium]|nr:Flp pilus assembly protein CpaB [Caulobacter sp.]